MARDFVSELTALADGVRQAQALVDRKADLERQVRDVERHLAEKCEREIVASAAADEAAEKAKQIVASAERDAVSILAGARDECASKFAACERSCASREAEADARVKRLAVECDEKRASVVRLEAEETRLAQSVAKLTEELAALRSRVGL